MKRSALAILAVLAIAAGSLVLARSSPGPAGTTVRDAAPGAPADAEAERVVPDAAEAPPADEPPMDAEPERPAATEPEPEPGMERDAVAAADRDRVAEPERAAVVSGSDRDPTGSAGGPAAPDSAATRVRAPADREMEPGPKPAADQEVDPAPILRSAAAAYEDLSALRAEFTMRLHNRLLGRTTESAGTLYQRQPDRFLMRFSDPDGDVIVSDGRHFWVYYPSVNARQVIRSSGGGGPGSAMDLRAQFIGDPTRRFAATYQGRDDVAGRPAHVLTLTPRAPAGYQSLKVWIDAADHLVRRFEIREENGNVRRVELRELRRNPALPDSLFRFEPPEGARIIDRG